MKRADRISGFIWLVLGLGLCLGSFKLKIGELRNPGAGFMPLLAGTLLSLFGFILLVSPGSQDPETNSTIKERGTFIQRVSAFLTPAFILIVFVALFEPLGFLLATFFFLFTLFKFVEPKKWLMPFSLSLTSVILSHLVFNVWLRCQFPRGILAF